ncbi:MAG: SAM-dependent methyltransferase [Clostridia bacterium]|nr:SAM-dependent methyltransferase [Clostridia bacterium]
MSYGKRIDLLCSLFAPTDVFADVGCDHGYCSEYMLKNGLCEKAILSDVSKGSLQKAATLLRWYVENGRAECVLGDGFAGVEKDVGEVVIAGMGGAEIIKILSDKRHGFVPKRFVLQPMLNTDKLRRWLVENGGYIERDFTFFADGKYYDVIVGRRAQGGERQTYDELAFEFGKENLTVRGEDFLARVRKLLTDTERFLAAENLSAASREELLARKKRLEEVLKNDGKGILRST